MLEDSLKDHPLWCRRHRRELQSWSKKLFPNTTHGHRRKRTQMKLQSRHKIFSWRQQRNELPSKTDWSNQIYIYEEQQSAVLLECRTSRWFPFTKGVRQGCMLLPHIFSIYTDAGGRTWPKKRWVWRTSNTWDL